MNVAVRSAPARVTALLASPAIAADVEWCRRILPRVSRTFAINIRLLGGSMGETVRIAYLLCRIADTIEDAWPGDRRELEHRFDALLAAIEGDITAIESLAGAAAALHGRASADCVTLIENAPAVLRCFTALAPADRADVAEAVTVLTIGMRRYAGRAAERARRSADAEDGAAGVARVAYLDDDAELDDYCFVVAGCIGVMLTKLFSRRATGGSRRLDADRLALAPRVGAGLQLTNILLDWPSDVRAGRCHVPASWLEARGLGPADLVGAPSAALQELVDRLESRARGALAAVPEYLATIPSRHVRYRMFCLWPALWALASLRQARQTPEFPWGARRPRLPRLDLWGLAAATLPLGHSRAGTTWLLGHAARP